MSKKRIKLGNVLYRPAIGDYFLLLFLSIILNNKILSGRLVDIFHEDYCFKIMVEKII